MTLFLMPMMVSPVVAGLLWFYLYNGTFGWYHWLFESLGILGGASILGRPETALYGIVIVDVWQWTPLITLITLAGLKRVRRTSSKPAWSTGRVRYATSSRSVCRTFPVPADRDPVALHGQFRFIDAILALTGGGPADSTKLLPVYLFDVSFKFFKLGRGGAIAFSLLVVTIILGLILVRIFEDPARKKACRLRIDGRGLHGFTRNNQI